jgi:hypothetical protein
MQLNLPILDQVSSCRSLLIAGMGGGFDLFCGLPIYFELQRRGQRAHLANFADYHLTEKTLGSRLWISPLMAIITHLRWVPGSSIWRRWWSGA